VVGGADKYYTPFTALFIKDAILFENFMLDSKEISFTKDIFLSAFIEVYRKTGCKPLIVALEPTDIEGDEFWPCHPNGKTSSENQQMGYSQVRIQDLIENQKPTS